MGLFKKCRLQGLRSRQKRSLLFVNEYFSGERNTARGTLCPGTNYILMKRAWQSLLQKGHV
jgi:hypothetical protein